MTTPVQGDGFAVQLVPQNVEKLPLYHWRPGARLLSVGSRDGASFLHNSKDADVNTFARPLNESLLMGAQEKMHTNGLCATYSNNLDFPENMKLLQQHSNGALVLITAGYGDVAVLEQMASALDACVVLRTFDAAPLDAALFDLDCHKELVLALDQESVPDFDIPWTRFAAVHICPLRPHAQPVEWRAPWYAAIRSQVPKAVAVYDEDHQHSICPCGATLVWRTAGRSRLDELDLTNGQCKACGAKGNWVAPGN